MSAHMAGMLAPAETNLPRVNASRRGRVRLMTDSANEIGWMRAYTALEDFAGAAGHTAVPKGHRAGGIDLGLWVNSQRAAHAQGRISADRAGKLEAVPGWAWTGADASWVKWCSALESFAVREGHTRVPHAHREHGLRLGDWAHTKRAQRGRLDAAQIAQLEAIPGWVWSTARDVWAEGLEALRAYAQRTGHAHPPTRLIDADGFDLGGWVARQRRNHREGTLAPDRVAVLEALPGWTWEAAKTDRPASAVAAEETLNRGLEVLSAGAGGRQAKCVPQAAPARMADPLCFGERSRPFVEALNVYVEREGHADVPVRHIEGVLKLGSWVHGRRNDHRAGRLSGERTAELESLPGWSWGQGDFLDGLALLVTYAEREGHSKVPQGHVEDGFNLGRWVMVRRREYRGGVLAQERAQLLELVPGWWWGNRRKG